MDRFPEPRRLALSCAFPLALETTFEAQLLILGGDLKFVDEEAGCAHTTLNCKLIQEDDDSDISIEWIRWQHGDVHQPLTGALGGSAEDYLRSKDVWPILMERFRFEATPDVPAYSPLRSVFQDGVDRIEKAAAREAVKPVARAA